ncbi:MAG TPA: 5-deoxy-glucuronate isomerase [Nocardioidaceae bacterium]|jgi:5-deoxy-glucuronate isomerase|nr:5-deoxy-glucuronate isomerase [Nocardioidaceae bacterium]
MTTSTTHTGARLHVPSGSTGSAPWALSIAPEDAGWEFSGLRVLQLPPGGSATFETGEAEALVLPLSGACTVTCDGERFALSGRESVFTGVTDFAYVPRDAEVTVSSEEGGRFAVPSARCERRLTARYGPAESVPVELRGAGQCSRQVNNFCTPDAFDADNLIACEVLTPGGNWSSYPPHKHDTAREGESVLEEIYYYEVGDGPHGALPDAGSRGVAYQRVYGEPDRPVDVLAEVRGGDVVLIPHGWHGPSMATPGYDLYYLNVMAGPGAERAWKICDDPRHGWIRDTWAEQEVDPRLPMSGPGAGSSQEGTR